MKPLRLFVVRSSLLATLGCGAVLLLLDPVLAKGLVLGGLARTLTFWIMARDVVQVENLSASRLKFRIQIGFALRMLVYTLVLVKAYSWDTEHVHGFFAAAAGLMIVCLMIAIAVVTGRDATRTS